MRTRFQAAFACAVLALGCNTEGGQSGTDGLEVDRNNPPTDDDTLEPPTDDDDDDAGSPNAEPEPAAPEPTTSTPEPAPTEPSGPRENIDTDWLGFCGGGCAPGLSCVCGVCTVACTDTADCGGLGERGQCVPPQPADPAGCYRALNTAVCDLSCSSNEHCSELSELHVCDRGRCRGPALGWMESLCEEPPVLSVPECRIDEQLRTSDYCESLECVSFPAECTQTGEGVTLDCATEPVVRWNTTLGRCEHVEACQSGSFTTIEACWESCEATNAGMCLEEWLPLTGEQAAEINGISAAEVTNALERNFSANARFPDGTETTIHLDLSDVRVFEVIATPNPNFTLDIVPSCFTTQVAEVNARLYTDDGQFDETWERLRVDVTTPEELYFRVQVIVPGSEQNPHDGPSLKGSYAPEADAEHCLLGSAISGTIAGDVFTGDVFHTRSTRPCGDPLGAVTTGSPNETGPVW